MKFRKKPVVIEAMRVPETTKTDEAILQYGRIASWMAGNSFMEFRVSHAGGYDIDTLEGCMHAAAGDWIIKGVKGEFYPCKPDIFAATYEAVDE